MARPIVTHKSVDAVVVEVTPTQRLAFLEKHVKQLERDLIVEKKDCIQALRERDFNGRQWRKYQILCNAAGIAPTIDLTK